MSRQTSGGKAQIPEWWSTELYRFLEKAELKCWCWEFYRRYVLKRAYGPGHPVDAMNPTEEGAMYRPWPKVEGTKLARTFGDRPAALCQKLTKHKRHFSEPEKIQGLLEIHIDLSRPDKVLRDDFWTMLQLIRKEIKGKPARSTHKTGDWYGNHILEVWDLRQFNVEAEMIQLQLNLNSVQSVYNARRSAKRMIEHGGWKLLRKTLPA